MTLLTKDEAYAMQQELYRLRAENARLRRALAKIANYEVALAFDVATPVQKIAEQALADQGKG
jgi:anti-sigma factor RsiW